MHIERPSYLPDPLAWFELCGRLLHELFTSGCRLFPRGLVAVVCVMLSLLSLWWSGGLSSDYWGCVGHFHLYDWQLYG